MPEQPFVGWLRIEPDGRWHRACAAETWEACWRLLLAIRPAWATSVEKVVLRQGVPPWVRRWPR
jgi:hypothetical protein